MIRRIILFLTGFIIGILILSFFFYKKKCFLKKKIAYIYDDSKLNLNF